MGSTISTMPGVLQYQVEDNKPTVIRVTGSDGAEYEVKFALIISGVVDTGLINPLDNTPVLSIQAATAVQVKRRADA
jgi:hypothetical protein